MLLFRGGVPRQARSPGGTASSLPRRRLETKQIRKRGHQTLLRDVPMGVGKSTETSTGPCGHPENRLLVRVNK